MGRNNFKIIFIATLLIVTFVAYTAVPVFSAQLKFKDITASKYDWVRPYIEKMALAEIIKGMTDTSYEPDASITRAQTVTTLVRMMGWEEQAKGKQFSDTFPKLNQVPSWAREYVALAVEKDIIAGDDFNDFRPNDVTKRSELAVFAVRALGLGKDAENRKNVNVSTTFTDGYSIELADRAFVEIAIEKEIMKGYPDNTFKPNEKVTRAEMAKVLNNIAKATDPHNIVVGEVQDVDTILLPSITVKLSSGSLKTYNVDKSTSIYKEDDKGALAEAKLQDIKVGGHVHVIPSRADNNKASYVDMLYKSTTYVPPTHDGQSVSGTIKDISTSSRVLTIVDNKGAIKVYNIKTDAGIYIEGKKGSIKDLTAGQPITLSASQYEVSRIDVENFNKITKGIYKLLDTRTNLLTIENRENDKLEYYTVASEVRVTKDGKSANLYDIRVGDVVSLTISDSKVKEIDVESANTEIEGEIIDINLASRNPRIIIEDDRGREKEFEVDKKVSVRKNRKTSYIEDLRIGDRINVELEYDIAIRITAESIQRDISGVLKTIIFADVTTVTITDDKGKDHTIKITRDTDIYRDRKLIEPSDLRRDYYLDIEVENDEALRIDVTTREVQNTLQGIVKNINEDFRVMVITVKDASGKRQDESIHYDYDTTIQRDNREVSIRRIYEGDEVIVVGSYQDGVFVATTIIDLTITD